jgi:hypothetical protein
VVVAAAAGRTHVTLLLSSGVTATWGCGAHGQLGPAATGGGDGGRAGVADAPSVVLRDAHVVPAPLAAAAAVAVAAGGDVSAALDARGQVGAPFPSPSRGRRRCFPFFRLPAICDG